MYAIEIKYALLKFYQGYVTISERNLIEKVFSQSTCSNLMKDHTASICANQSPYAFVSSVRFCSCGIETRRIYVYTWRSWSWALQDQLYYEEPYVIHSFQNFKVNKRWNPVFLWHLSLVNEVSTHNLLHQNTSLLKSCPETSDDTEKKQQMFSCFYLKSS